jgi:hypothetical protein
MTMTLTNGRPVRKQLSDQLDRLDGIIDCLADALPAAVAGAFQEGARQAIRDAIVEVLANPQLRSLLAAPAVVAPSTVPIAPPAPLFNRVKARLAGLTSRARAVAARVFRRTATARDRVRPVAKAAGLALRFAWQWRLPCLIAVAVGIATAVGSYSASHSFSAAVSGVGGAVTALALQAGIWIRKAIRSLSPRSPVFAT